MPLDGLTTEALHQTVESLRQEAAELREGLEVAIVTSRRSREKARRLREELQQVHNLSGLKEGGPGACVAATGYRPKPEQGR
jgi:hypothetical protein